MTYVIQIVEPGAAPRLVDVIGPVVVGHESTDLPVNDPTVDSRHLLLEPTSSGLLATDLGSRYGTQLNNAALVGPTLLGVGDLLYLGNTNLAVGSGPVWARDIANANLRPRTAARQPSAPPPPAAPVVGNQAMPEAAKSSAVPPNGSEDPPGRPSALAWLMIAALAAFALVVGAVLLTSTSTTNGSDRHDASGQFDVRATGLRSALPNPCTGVTSDYPDIRVGTPVKITDENGQTVGSSSLGSGVPKGGSCSFRYHISNLPRRAFYTVEVGSRGEVTFSYADLVSNNWMFTTTLG